MKEISDKSCKINSKVCCSDEREAQTKGRAFVESIITQASKIPLTNEPVLLPGWYNHDSVLRGQNYFIGNVFSMFVGKLSGLLTLLVVPSILRVLVATKKSFSPSTAYERYLRTIFEMLSWYQSDLRNPNSKGRQSIERVRKHHWLASQLHGPITQMDLALTQFGFVGIPFIGYESLGLPEDQEDLTHYWKVIGHLIGLQERFNMCRGCKLCTRASARELSSRIFGPGLDKPPEGSLAMSEALLTGVWPIVPLMHPEAFKELTRRLCGQLPKPLDFYPQFSLTFQLFVHKLLNITVISFLLKPYMNFLIWLTIYVQKYTPVLAYFAYGTRNNNIEL